jgi:hypothetical protein
MFLASKKILEKVLSSEEILNIFFDERNGFGSRAMQAKIDAAAKQGAGSQSRIANTGRLKAGNFGSYSNLDSLNLESPEILPELDLMALSNTERLVREAVTSNQAAFEVAVSNALEQKGIDLETVDLMISTDQGRVMSYPGQPTVMKYINQQIAKARDVGNAKG